MDETLKDLTIASAHESLGQDLLITTSPVLVDSREDSFVSKFNPYTPAEAVSIIGLFLRSRNNYTYQLHEYENEATSKRTTNRDPFYWMLVLSQVPLAHEWVKMNTTPDKRSAERAFRFAETVLLRCSRVLQARDSIGIDFYRANPAKAQDQMMDRFDHICVTLAGAFDALAQLAKLVHGLDGEKSLRANFWPRKKGRSNPLLVKLRQKGARELCDLMESEDFANYSVLLYSLRNFIHEDAVTSLTALGYIPGYASEIGLADPKNGHELWNAAEELDSAQIWGFVGGDQYLFEPYAYANELIRRGLALINQASAFINLNPSLGEDIILDGMSEEPEQFTGIDYFTIRRIKILGSNPENLKNVTVARSI